ncbi:MAG TPA: serine hydrolase [Erythrobacter sp.]|nr:serine hydrolase [Erythrobacter sp.]
MIRTAFVAATTLLIATPVIAQSQQELLDQRYDRVLAAGYKALFLCGAIANAERNGATRSPESVLQWELSGIQPPLDSIVGALPFEITRNSSGTVERVEVSWADDMPPRVAAHIDGAGCRNMPVGLKAHSESPENKSGGSMRSAPISAKSAEWPVASLSVDLTHEFTGAFNGTYGDGSRTTAVLVLRGNEATEMYVESFSPDTPQRTWSVAKSIASTLVGAAAHRGEADVSVSAGLGEDESDPRRAVTIDHLLRMSSGRYSDTPGNRTNTLYYGGSSIDETAAHWPLVYMPGSVYRYANNDTLMAISAIKGSFEAYPPADVFAKLGMHHTVAETDWKGDYILSSQVWSTARDLARLGQLYLDGGVLPNGVRVLPEDWVEYVSTPSGPQPEGRGIGYGAGWWLFNNSEGIPSDTFAAMGNRGQYLVVVPSMDVVIVRRGEDPTGSRFDIVAFTRDVLKEIE